MTDQIKLIRTGCQFIGEHEISGNQGFVNPAFQRIIERSGWKKGEAWCVYLVEAIFRESGFDAFADVFSASAVETYRICRKSNLFEISAIPAIGDVVIWQNYENDKASWSGHAGLIIGMGRGHLAVLEGNTNSEGGREGIEVAVKCRNPQDKPLNGLRVLGFIRKK